MFLTFKCHVYIKKCFLGILITAVNSQGDVKWIRGAPGRERGTGGRGMKDECGVTGFIVAGNRNVMGTTATFASLSYYVSAADLFVPVLT